MTAHRPVLILSTGRSGSSYVAKQFYDAGLFGGMCRPADQWNPEGYYENVRIHAALRSWYGRGWLGEWPEAQDGWREFVEESLDADGYTGGPWFFKCGAFYYKTFDSFDPLYVKVWRDPDRIFESYKRCRFLNKWQDTEIKDIIKTQHDVMKKIDGLDVHIG